MPRAAVVLADITRFRMLDQFKSDLVATVSHELKTPLTSVRLAVHILLEEKVGPLTAKQTELLVDARDSSERLLVLIDQLLDLARLQRSDGDERRQDSNPADLLRRAADEVRPRAEDKHVALVIDPPVDLPMVRVDVERMTTALRNLVQNAVTYTPAGGTVTMDARQTDDGRVELIVADTGVGISPEYLPHVFDRFFRIPGQSNPTGTGLGLAIVKEVVTTHGGTISVESEPGHGTRFQLILPSAGRTP
jgi:signal transduction histidine kinase